MRSKAQFKINQLNMRAYTSSEFVKVANSLIIYNLGCEMVYLINHRLKSILKEPLKVQKVRHWAKKLDYH